MKYRTDAQGPAGINRNSSADFLRFYLEPPARQSSRSLFLTQWINRYECFRGLTLAHSSDSSCSVTLVLVKYCKG